MVLSEPVYAELRDRLGLRRFHRRGLSGVRSEFALYCIAFNLKKALTRRVVVVIFVVAAPADALRAHTARLWTIGIVVANFDEQ